MANAINIQLFNRVTLKERSLFTRALATMVASGLPVVRALGLLGKQTRNKFFAGIIAQIIRRIEEGDTLSSAFSKFPKVFDNVYVASLRAAEASGKLEEILKELADQKEKDYKLISSIKGAITYPIMIIVFMLFTGIVLMTMVVPKFETLFEETNVPLPLATKILIGTSTFLLNYWYVILLVLIAGIIWFRYYLKTRNGQLFYAGLVLGTPFIREFFVDAYMSRFCRTLGMMTSAGVPIMESVRIVGAVINNAIYQNILEKVSHQIERGIPMSAPLSQSKEFPPIVSQMISTGEQTGKLDEVMISLSGYFEEETANKVKTISSLIEPILIFIVGIGVGIMVFAIIVPIYQISSSMK